MIEPDKPDIIDADAQDVQAQAADVLTVTLRGWMKSNAPPSRNIVGSFFCFFSRLSYTNSLKRQHSGFYARHYTKRRQKPAENEYPCVLKMTSVYQNQ